MPAQATPGIPTATVAATVELRVNAPYIGVIDEARGRQRRQRICAAMITAAVVAIVLGAAWGGGNGTGPRPAPKNPAPGRGGFAERNGGSGLALSLSIVGVSLVAPPGWFGRTTVVGAGNSAWLQATNFPAQGLAGGNDRIKAMRPADVTVTICECNTSTGGSTHRTRVRPLTLVDDMLPADRTPRGHLLLETSAFLAGRLLTIDADFGSQNAARRLLPVVNRMLGTLRVHTATHG